MRAGVSADTEGRVVRLSEGELPWLVYISASLIGLVAAFGASIGSEAGKDAWKGLKRLVGDLSAARRKSGKPEGAIRVDDLDNGGRTIILHDDLPDEAFRFLAEEGLTEAGYFTWDEKERRWRSSL